MNKIVKFEFYFRKKGEEHMCIPINKIYGKSALQVLTEFGDNDIPVNLSNLLYKIGISALPMDFTSLEKN